MDPLLQANDDENPFILASKKIQHDDDEDIKALESLIKMRTDEEASDHENSTLIDLENIWKQQ